MAKKEWVVRVIILAPAPIDGLTSRAREYKFAAQSEFLEQLRYAGLAQVHADTSEKLVFDLHCREARGRDTDLWAKMNAERMRSFGYNAVKAPAWEPFQPKPE